MADVIFVAVICAFFALCVVYIRWCDRIVGPDEFTARADESADVADVAMMAGVADVATVSGEGVTA